jgi:hypothetical protein
MLLLAQRVCQDRIGPKKLIDGSCVQLLLVPQPTEHAEELPVMEKVTITVTMNKLMLSHLVYDCAVDLDQRYWKGVLFDSCVWGEMKEIVHWKPVIPMGAVFKK